MKKIFLILFLLISAHAFSQSVEERAGFYDNGKIGKKFSDTVYNLPHVPLFYFNGYGNFVSLADTVRSLFSIAKSPLSYNNATGVFDFDTTTHHSYLFYQTVFGSGGDGGSSQWVTNGDDIYYPDGYVGIGIDTPSAPLEITMDSITTNIVSGLTLSNKKAATLSVSAQLAPAFTFESQFYGGGVSTKSLFQIQPSSLYTQSLSFLYNGVVQMSLTSAGGLLTKAITNAGSFSQSGFMNITGSFAAKTGVFSPTATNPSEPRANIEIQPNITNQQTLMGPRFSTTDKLTITSGIVSGTISGGSGYTNGTFTGQSFTGGSGTLGKATIIVSGGTVTTVNISVQGKNYKIGDVLSASLAGGTGFTYTITKLGGSAGLEGYDTTTNGKEYYNGESWAKVRMTIYKKVTADYTATNKDNVISVDNGASNVTITLPDAATLALHIFTIKRYDNNSTGTVTIATSGGNVQSISALTFGSTTTLAAVGSYGQVQEFISNGTDYEIK